MKEEKLYKIVKNQLEKKKYGYLCANPFSSGKRREGFLRMGIKDVQADIVGFKDAGVRRESKIEVIAVEVKPYKTKYGQREIDQAKRASIYAHKCFFAAPREFRSSEIEIAVNNGVGLFQIIDKKRLKQIVPSVEMHPEEKNVIRLMEHLGYFKCSICGSYWNKHWKEMLKKDKKTSPRLHPVGYRAKDFFHIGKGGKRIFDKFICGDCAETIFWLFSPHLKAKYAEKHKFDRLRKKFTDFKKRVRKNEKSVKPTRGLNLEGKIKRLERNISTVKKRLKKIAKKIGDTKHRIPPRL